MRMAPTKTGKAAVLVIDMQAGLFDRVPPPHDAAAVVERINRLTARARAAGAPVVFIQHDGDADEPVVLPGTAGWQLHTDLVVGPKDKVIRKTTCDAFHRTVLEATLRAWRVTTLVIAGYATEFCVDSTVRAALSRDFRVLVAADAHTTRDHDRWPAAQTIAQHNWVWKNMITPAGIAVAAANRIRFAPAKR